MLENASGKNHFSFIATYRNVSSVLRTKRTYDGTYWGLKHKAKEDIQRSTLKNLLFLTMGDRNRSEEPFYADSIKSLSDQGSAR